MSRVTEARLPGFESSLHHLELINRTLSAWFSSSVNCYRQCLSIVPFEVAGRLKKSHYKQRHIQGSAQGGMAMSVITAVTVPGSSRFDLWTCLSDVSRIQQVSL